MLDNNGERESDEDVIDNHIQEIVYNSFLDSFLYLKIGFILGLYRICGISSFFIALSTKLNYSDKDNIAAKNTSEEELKSNPLKAVNAFSVLLPILAIVYDNQVLRSKQR